LYIKPQLLPFTVEQQNKKLLREFHFVRLMTSATNTGDAVPGKVWF
jgi:hypothetical protein